MNKVVERWRSDRVQRDLTLARWGTIGQPVLVFPTAGGDAEEIERWQMIKVLGPLLEAGKIKPVIFKTFPLEQAAAAHALMESSTHVGKIVLQIV